MNRLNCWKIVELKANADDVSIEAEKKRSIQDIKVTITQSNALKTPAEEKQQNHWRTSGQRRKFGPGSKNNFLFNLICDNHIWSSVC